MSQVRVLPGLPIFRIPEDLELPAQFNARAGNVIGLAQDSVHGIRAHQPAVTTKEIELIAKSQRVLVGYCYRCAGHGLDSGHFSHDLSREIEQITDANSATPGIPCRVVELGESCQRIGFEVDAGILEQSIAATGEGLRPVETDKGVEIRYKS